MINKWNEFLYVPEQWTARNRLKALPPSGDTVIMMLSSGRLMAAILTSLSFELS